jgi:uncharacterized membrane protein YbhN (UPF0104 family)
MSMQQLKSSIQLVIPFLVSVVVISFITGFVTFSFIYGIIAFIVSSICCVLFAVPLFLIFQKISKVNWITSIGSGFFIAFLFAFLTTYPWSSDLTENVGYGNDDYTPIYHGVLTYRGWMDLIGLSLTTGLIGAIGGMAFYFCYKDILKKQNQKYIDQYE